MTIQDSSGLMMENGGSCLLCTPDEERQLFQDLKTQSELDIKEGNLWYRNWERYVGVDEPVIDNLTFDSQHTNGLSSKTAERPGPIDNSDIIDNGNGSEGDDIQVRRNLEEGQDYFLVPQQVWEKLVYWYKGGPALPRKMICEGIFREKRVEVYPLSLKLIDSRDNSHSIIRLSKKASTCQLYEKVCTIKGIVEEKTRIWDYFNQQRSASPLGVSDQTTLDDAMLQMDQDILLEVQVHNGVGMDSTGNELALVPVEPPRSSTTIAGGPVRSNG